jgi:hypothetical protein
VHKPRILVDAGLFLTPALMEYARAAPENIARKCP